MKINNIYYVIAQSEKDAYNYLMFHLTSSFSNLSFTDTNKPIQQLKNLKEASPAYNSYQIYTVVLNINIEPTVLV